MKNDYAFRLGRVIGALIVISFCSWIITLAFPITFFQAFLIVSSIEIIVKAFKVNSK